VNKDKIHLCALTRSKKREEVPNKAQTTVHLQWRVSRETLKKGTTGRRKDGKY